MRKFTALFLLFSVLVLSADLFSKERRGANVVITKKDGQELKGELIAVKQGSLLLLSESGADVSVDIRDVWVIRIMKRSKFWRGVLTGLFVGMGSGALTGFLMGDEKERKGMFWKEATAEGRAAVYGISFGFIGPLAGGAIGTSNRVEIMHIEGKSEAEVKMILEKLRKKARVRDFQ